MPSAGLKIRHVPTDQVFVRFISSVAFASFRPLGLGLDGNVDPERAAFVFFALKSDLSVQYFDDLFGDGQADANAFYGS